MSDSGAFKTTTAIGTAGEFHVMSKVLGPRFKEVFRVGGGQLSLAAECSIGDILLRRSSGQLLSMEVKTETTWTGNFVWEHWSNRRTGRPGWSETSKADVLGYLYLGNMRCLVFDFRRLREWANGPSIRGRKRRVSDFREIEQSKYVQPNDTWFYAVPFSTAGLPPKATFVDGQRLQSEVQVNLFDASGLPL